MVKLEIYSRPGYTFDREMVRREIEKMIMEQGRSGDMEVCLVVVGRRKMKQLHQQYMETAEVTDVLSFPLSEQTEGIKFVPVPDGVIHLGDIVICYPVAVAQAKTGKNRTVDEEMAFLAGHGCLHLLGVHHE